jgi:hypothetical protein
VHGSSPNPWSVPSAKGLSLLLPVTITLLLCSGGCGLVKRAEVVGIDSVSRSAASDAKIRTRSAGSLI